MIDVDQRLREELDLLAPATPGPDWDGVLRLAGRRRRRFAVAAAVVAAAACGILVATPLGAGIVHGLGGFSAWLTGQPGEPASPKEQRAFEQANARSWLGFPAGTQLRRLATVTEPATGTTVDLFGFRSRSRLCLRVGVTGKTRGTATSCGPLDELRKAGAPVRVVLVDSAFGTGTKKAWYGLTRYRNSALQVTAGIIADGVRRVLVVDGSGRHTIRATSNAFLYVASEPDVGQRVRRIWAETDTSRIRVPFAPAPFGVGGGSAPQRRAPAPPTVDRKVRGGTIGWLNRHEPRGQPLDVLPASARWSIERHAVFGRVITPDPDRPLRVAITLNHSRHGHRAKGLCMWLMIRDGGSGGGCAVRATVFAQGPIPIGQIAVRVSSDEFATVQGLASDDVARIVAFLADGQTMPVPLADNVYVVDIARVRLPARLVAYDAKHRVIGYTTTITAVLGGGPSPARGRARLLLHGVSPTGTTAALYVGKSTTGGRCMFLHIRQSKHVGGTMQWCSPARWRGSPLLLNALPGLVAGAVRPDVATVVFRFADGTRATVTPTEGFVLYVVPRAHLARGHELVGAVARTAAGKTIGTQPFARRR
ncbi:MAG TPA: hypothetical protein VE596_19660 [Gaiellaceae bacterium]|jgi:hypothetical protein|nr:hypothetical protein [Gaiellaceae bacterium]